MPQSAAETRAQSRAAGAIGAPHDLSKCGSRGPLGLQPPVCRHLTQRPVELVCARARAELVPGMAGWEVLGEGLFMDVGDYGLEG